MSLYMTVLAEELRDGLCRFLNKSILLQLWPVLHKLISTTVKGRLGRSVPRATIMINFSHPPPASSQ
jgi:hypothetical protein